MSPVNVIGKVNINKIIEELDKNLYFKDELQQRALQGVKGQTDNLYGIDKIKDLNHKEEDFKYPIADAPYLNSILKEYGMLRTRLLRLKPFDCYSYHIDPTPRIHIPLINDEYCLGIIDDVVYRLPADGSVYAVDTTLRHTFLNGGDYDRLHIVGIKPDLS